MPVNPGLAGQELLGETVYGEIAEILFDVDMVNIFRPSATVPKIVDAALVRWPDLCTIWMQLGVQHPESAAKAKVRGIDVVQDRCLKIAFDRLFSAQSGGGA